MIKDFVIIGFSVFCSCILATWAIMACIKIKKYLNKKI